MPPGESHNRTLLASPLPGRLWANMTSSTKPEVRNVVQRLQKRTELRLQVTCTAYEVSTCGFWDIRADRRKSDRQLIAILHCPNGGRNNEAKWTTGKVLSWEYRSPRKRNSRPPASVILCCPNTYLFSQNYLRSRTVAWSLYTLEKKSPVYGVFGQ